MAITSNSKVKEILADEQAAAVVGKYLPGFAANADNLTTVMDMRFSLLIKFPQAGVSKETQQALCAELDALDQ